MTTPGRNLLVWGMILILAMAAIEGIHSVRLASVGDGGWRNPIALASQGVRSLVALFRPPDSFSSDIQPALIATSKALHGDSDLYLVPGEAAGDFIYPPSATIALLPLGVAVNLSNVATATRLADLFGRLCVLATLVLCGRQFRNLLSGKWPWVFLLLFFYAFFPLRWMLIRVQAQSLVTLLLVGGIVLYGRSRYGYSGLLIGLASVIKPHLGLLVLFGVTRKRWRFVIGAGSIAGFMIGISLLLVGADPWRIYLTEVLPRIGVGYASYPNQSILGALHRWVGHPAGGFDVPPTSDILSFTARAGFVLFLILSIVPRIRQQNGNAHLIDETGPSLAATRSLDLGISVLCLTLGSPIAWEHHYAWTLFLFALLGANLRGRNRIALAVSFLLLGSYWLPFPSISSGSTTLIHSLPCLGAIILLVTAWSAYVRWHRHRSTGRETVM